MRPCTVLEPRAARRALPLAALLLIALGGHGVRAAAPAAVTELSVPPFLEDRLVYYRGFERADGTPAIDALDARPTGRLAVGPGGIRGRCAASDRAQALVLRSPAFSPHRPLSVAFWWALRDEPTPETCFGLFHLSGGRGYVSHFSRGKGTWCALARPAAILQVWNFPGIRNVNGIYDRDLAAHVELRAGAWHHAAIVFRGASLVEVYTDGRRAWSARLRGRPFAESDGVCDLVVGSRRGIRMALDEVMVFRRALAAEEIRTYVAAIRQMRAVGYPVRP